MKTRLDISQSQKTLQHLSPQQVQFVRLLEMNTAEIEEKVRRELDENPALEAADNDFGENPSAESPETEEFTESAEQLQDADYRSEEDMPFERRFSQSSDERNVPAGMDMNVGDNTPVEELVAQLRDYELTPDQKKAAINIIGNLDANGRLTRPLNAIADDIAIATGTELAQDDINRAFEAIRSMEPAGIGAVDLRDCLLLQLRRKPRTLATRVALEIVDKHFDLLSHKYYKRMQTALGIDENTLRDALAVIRSLNPKPWAGGDMRASDRLRHVSADFLVERLDDGYYSVSLTQHLPKLDIERSFQPSATPVGESPREKAEADSFIRRKREEASSFISLLERRTRTLLSVMESIVRLQPEFFANEDTASIRPMILRDIAALTGLDLSVISRATSGKYVATGGGIYPIKMFFNEKPKEDNDTSSHQIQQAIREIIDGEDGSNPLSDDAICRIMNERGFDIARRTVAKYREHLSIPVARLRRRI